MKDFKKTGFGLIALVLLVMSTNSANARPERLSLEEMRRAIEVVKDIGFDTTDELVQPRPAGGEDTLLITRNPFDETVVRLFQAFSNNEILADGYQILAHATNKKTGNVNFTMKSPDGYYFLVQVLNDDDFASIRIDGDVARKRR